MGWGGGGVGWGGVGWAAARIQRTRVTGLGEPRANRDSTRTAGTAIPIPQNVRLHLRPAPQPSTSNKTLSSSSASLSGAERGAGMHCWCSGPLRPGSSSYPAPKPTTLTERPRPTAAASRHEPTACQVAWCPGKGGKRTPTRSGTALLITRRSLAGRRVGTGTDC